MSVKQPQKVLRAANDNGPGITTVCDLPDCLGIVEGEADLIARYLGDILALCAANDNDPGVSHD